MANYCQSPVVKLFHGLTTLTDFYFSKMIAAPMRKSFVARPNTNPFNGPVFWCWEYRAFLTLSTPLAVLKRHGERLFPSAQSEHQIPVLTDSEMDYAAWEITEITSHEIGLQQPYIWGSHDLAMDVPEGACLPERYYTFLVRFRGIIESIGAPSHKREALKAWLEREVWNDILVCWGGIAGFLDRVFPSFLLYIQDQGISPKVISALREVGICSQNELARTSDAELLSIPGVGPSISSKLRSYQIEDHSIESTDPYLQMIR